MTYRSLLVLLDADPLCAARTAFAIRTAQRLECHLVGLAPTGLLQLPASPAPLPTLVDFTMQAWDALREVAEGSAQQFIEACRRAGLPSFEAVVDQADVAASLVRHAHCSDLVLLSQADPAGPEHRLLQQMVERVVLESARPTLMLPCAGRFEPAGRHVLVAWDDSREAARAVADALPLLQRAEQVQVVCWQEGSSADDAALGSRLDALRAWLLRHGVQADVRVELTRTAIADAILSRAADLGADLLVMGAWGHARWTERLLGGATRGLLASMTLPVLLSH
jgi:nucleotide-binding universal stress UspA family protein